MPARLILNADDFGLTPGINRAVIELHRAGVLTSTTLMATGPCFAQAVALALANPTLGVGCHLVFTDGIPISHPESIPTLLGADGKTFRPNPWDFAQAALRGTIHPNDIAREAQAQIQKIQRAGIDVTHVDTHKHIHLILPSRAPSSTSPTAAASPASATRSSRAGPPRSPTRPSAAASKCVSSNASSGPS